MYIPSNEIRAKSPNWYPSIGLVSSSNWIASSPELKSCTSISFKLGDETLSLGPQENS